MATMLEKKMNSIMKEIEKYEKSLATHEARLAKKVAKAESLNCNWNREEFFTHRDSDMNDAQWEAYFAKRCEENEVNDIKRHLENAFTRLNKIAPKVEAQMIANEAESEFTQKANRIEKHWLSVEEQQKKYEEWLKNFKAECLKDGVVIEEAHSTWVNGTTPSGKRFVCDINNGWTERSRYCYSLRIGGNTIFTSGTFTTAYSTIVKS